MPKKKKPFQFVNMKPSLKKIENDISSIDSSIGGAHAEIINLAQIAIQREGFIDARNSVIRGSKGGKIYKPVAGATLGRKNSSNGEKLFHKTKLMDRSGSLPPIFSQLNFQKGSFGSGTLYTAQNEGIEVKIIKDRRRIKAVYSLRGKYDRIFGIFENGSKKERITSPNGRIKNVRKGQKRVVRQGLGKALRRWDKINKFYLERTLKERSLASI